MRGLRKTILLALVLLLAIGTVMIYSASGVYAHEKYGTSLFFLKRHLLYLCIGVAAFFTALALDLGFLRRQSRILLVLAAVLLTLVFIPGLSHSAGGARRWVGVFGFTFQPAEIAKIILIFYFADFLDRKQIKINNIATVLLPAGLIVGFFALMILLQPDFGMVILIAACIVAMFIAAGVNLNYLYGSILAFLPLAYFLIFRVEYRRRRILAFLSPWEDAQGSGFQVIQSFLALGSGGIFGVGLGRSTQKLYFLPESHTDFLFSIIGEELGYIGCLAVVFLFFVITSEGMRGAMQCENLFRKLLAFGMIFMITIEAIINICVGVGIFPTKGLPLPFVSYGGTHLIAHLFSIGLFFNATRERRMSGTHVRPKVQLSPLR